MGIPSWIPLAGQPAVASCSELNDRLVFVRTLENNHRIAWNKATWVVKFVVRAVEAKNCLAVEGSSLEGGAFPCRRLGGMPVVARLIVPLTD